MSSLSKSGSKNTNFVKKHFSLNLYIYNYNIKLVPKFFFQEYRIRNTFAAS